MRLLLIALLALLASTAVQAQHLGYSAGTRLGMGVSRFSGEGTSEFQGIFHGQIGFANQYWLHRNIGLGADLMFSSRGDKHRGTHPTITGNYEYTQRYNLYGVDVPVSFIFRYGVESFWFSAFVGYDIGFNVVGAESRIYDDDAIDDDFGYSYDDWNTYNVFNGGVFAGAGFSVVRKEKIYTLDARIMPGSMGSEVAGNSSWRNHIWAISFSTLF